MTNRELLETIVIKLESIDQRLGRVEQRLDKVEQRLDRVEQRLDSLEQRFDSLEQRVSNLESGQIAMEQRLANLESGQLSMANRLTNIELTLENEVSRNICTIAEAHLDLSRKFDRALKVKEDDELVRIRLNVLENERTGNGTDGLKSRLYHVSVLSGKAPGGADRHAADGAV